MRIFAQLRIPLVLALLSIALYACSTAELRDAQVHFSAGAAAENQQIVADLSHYQIGVTEISQQVALTDYRLAYSIADEIVTNPRSAAELSRDRLLGTAYMIKVYSLWRILALDGDQEQAVEVTDSNAEFATDLERLIAQIRADHTAGNINLGKRDAVMLDAFRGLTEHERALHAHDWDSADRLFLSAYCNLGKVATSAPPDHDVSTYLYMAQIQTLGAWGGATKRFLPTDAQRLAETRRINRFAGPPICGLKPRIVSAQDKQPLIKIINAQLMAIGTSYRTYAKKCPIAQPTECRTQ